MKQGTQNQCTGTTLRDKMQREVGLQVMPILRKQRERSVRCSFDEDCRQLYFLKIEIIFQKSILQGNTRGIVPERAVASRPIKKNVKYINNNHHICIFNVQIIHIFWWELICNYFINF